MSRTVAVLLSVVFLSGFPRSTGSHITARARILSSAQIMAVGDILLHQPVQLSAKEHETR